MAGIPNSEGSFQSQVNNSALSVSSFKMIKNMKISSHRWNNSFIIWDVNRDGWQKVHGVCGGVW